MSRRALASTALLSSLLLQGALLLVITVAQATTTENPLEWEFRLVGGMTALSGRVEMRPNNTAPWGTVCKDIFKENNYGPIAACNSAGLVGVTQAVYTPAYGAGTGPIYLTSVACNAGDQFIQNCSRSALFQVGACVHYEDVGVDCSPPIQLWKFKMVNGTAPSNGIVLMQPMPSLPWGAVYNWNFIVNSQWEFNREVMCRMMGYNTTLATSNYSYYFLKDPSITLPPYLYLQYCSSGSISHIGYCNYNNIGSNMFYNYDYLYLNCAPKGFEKLPSTTEVKLVNGWKNGTGIVMMRRDANDMWASISAADVASDYFSSPVDTTVATPTQQKVLTAICHTAGFPNATKARFGKYGPAGVTDIYGKLVAHFEKFNCTGAVGLGDCVAGPYRWTYYGTQSFAYAGVDCYPESYNLDTWQYRLVGNGSIGRIELRPDGGSEWRGVCPSPSGYTTFDQGGPAFNALCQRAGFNTNSATRSGLTFGFAGRSHYYLGLGSSCPSMAPINRFALAPGATLQQNCSLSPVGMHGCGPSSDLVLDCGFPPLHEMRIRLVGQNVSWRGRVEVKPGPGYDWGTLTDSWAYNNNYQFEIYAAFAVCRQLGFMNVSNAIMNNFGPGPSTMRSYWSNIFCNVGDLFLYNCTTGNIPWGFSHYATYRTLDMGVDCFPPPFDAIVKLEGGAVATEGRVMYQYSPYIPMGSVCNDIFKHNHFNWLAACRSVGFWNITRAAYKSFGPASYSLPISLDDVNCGPTDLYLQNCTHREFGQHNCHHGEDAGVDCNPPPEPTNTFEFRLADGTAATNGRVEMRPSSTFGWGSICAGPYFNHTVASWLAACRQVGFTNVTRASWMWVGKGSDTVYLDNVSCAATDAFLINCSRFPVGSHRCEPTEVAGVDCNPPVETPQRWEFRLKDGRSATSGRLEMRPDTKTPWGSVCRTGLFNKFEALKTVCRTAGFPAATRPVAYRGPAPPPAVRTYLDHAQCTPAHRYLHNCSYAQLYSYDCDPGTETMYVECFPTATAVPTPTPSRSRQPKPTVTRPQTPTGGWAPVYRTASANATATSTVNQTSRSATRRDTPTNVGPRTRTQPDTRSQAQSKTVALAATKSAGKTRSVPESNTARITPNTKTRPGNTRSAPETHTPRETLSKRKLSATRTIQAARTRSQTVCAAPAGSVDVVSRTQFLRPLATVYVPWPLPAEGRTYAVTVASSFPLRRPLMNAPAAAWLLEPVTLARHPSTASADALRLQVVDAAPGSPAAFNVSLAVVDAAAASNLYAVGGTYLAATAVDTVSTCPGLHPTLVVLRLVLVDADRASGDGSAPPNPPPPKQGTDVTVEVPESRVFGAPSVPTVAKGLLACSRDALTDSMAFYRMLSPFAFGPTHGLVIAGSAVMTVVVLLLQALTAAGMRLRGRKRSVVGCLSAARAPGISIAFAEPLWLGTAFSAGSIVVGEPISARWFAAFCACLCCLALPGATAFLVRRHLSRRLIAYGTVRPEPVPPRVAPHLFPYTRVKPEMLVKALAPVVSFRSVHPAVPALSGLSPALTALIVLLFGIPGLCPGMFLMLFLAHLGLAVAYAVVRPRRTTLLNAFAAAQMASIACVFGWAGLMLAGAPSDAAAAQGGLYFFIVVQTLFVGVRIALVPLAFFSDRLLPHGGAVPLAEHVATAVDDSGRPQAPFDLRRGDVDFERDDEDVRPAKQPAAPDAPDAGTPAASLLEVPRGASILSVSSVAPMKNAQKTIPSKKSITAASASAAAASGSPPSTPAVRVALTTTPAKKSQPLAANTALVPNTVSDRISVTFDDTEDDDDFNGFNRMLTRPVPTATACATATRPKAEPYTIEFGEL